MALVIAPVGLAAENIDWPPEQPEKPDNLLKVQAGNGNLDAAYRLGLFYAGQNSPEAWEWYCRAADQGHAESQVELGDWHRFDVNRAPPRAKFLLPISPDDRIALMWYTLAENNGSLGAATKERGIAKSLSRSQLQEAKHMVHDWKPGECPIAGDTPKASLEEWSRINWQIIDANQQKLKAQCAAQPERC